MKTMKLVFFFITLSAVIINAEPLLNIKLAKVNNVLPKNVNAIERAKYTISSILNKYSGISRRHNRRAQKQSTTFIKDEQLDIGYYGKVIIGGQNFNILLDTGSSNLFVPNKDCNSATCHNHNIFDPAKSKTFTADGKPWSIKFGIGSASGITGIDDVKMGDFTAKNLVFGLANTLSDDNIPLSFDGVCGLAFDNLNTMNTSTLVTAFAKQNGIDPIFSFHFSRVSDFDDQGTFTLGGVDENKFKGKINFNKIVNVPAEIKTVGLWQISVDDVIINNQPASFTGRSAIIDTGTSNIVMSDDDAAIFHNQIPGAQYVADSKVYIFPCNSTTVVAFRFGGIDYPLQTKDLILAPVDSDNCVSNIMPLPILGPTTWLIGVPFLKNVYSVFDMKNNNVGFAHAL